MISVLLSVFKAGSYAIDPLPKCLDLDSSARTALVTKLKALGNRSWFVRVVSAGSSNDCEHEIIALENPIYDMSRFGIKVVASPRHADILMVTGPISANMRQPLLDTYEAMPNPKLVLALGDGAIHGTVVDELKTNKTFKLSDLLEVDLAIPGDPPSPESILAHFLGLKTLCN